MSHNRKAIFSVQLRQKSVLPVEGKINQPVQTELYLEALTDQIDEVDVDCQTDAFLDRPPTPMFVPAKIGVDMETQIYEGDVSYFDSVSTNYCDFGRYLTVNFD